MEKNKFKLGDKVRCIKEDEYEIDEFDKIIKLLHESTHDTDIRESLLKVSEFRRKTFN